MRKSEDRLYFKIGNKEIYFYRNKELKRNCFGLVCEGEYVLPNHVNDVSFENPEEYLALVLAFLEQQSGALDMEESL
jgi:hypothetical protein